MNHQEVWVVIPTYWGPAEAGIYDHPTPLNGKSTLLALLESLVLQENPPAFSVLILVSTVSDTIGREAYEKVITLTAPYLSKLDLYFADARPADLLDQQLSLFDIDLQIKSMRGYAAVRNMQLIIPALFGAKTIIALDDDEIVPNNYMRQAVKWTQESHDGKAIAGVAGPYLDPSGSPYLPEPHKLENILLD